MCKQKQKGSDHGERAEVTLFEQAQGGCRESLDELMERHEGLIHYTVKRQRLYGLEYEEALQAGRRGLWRAILGYDPQRGTRFSTYAYVAIMRHVWKVVQSHRREKRREIPVQELALYYEAGPSAEELWQQAAIHQSLQELVERLPERMHRIMVAYYGLDGEEPQSYRQVGAQLGMSGEWARQLHLGALVWLRHPAHSQELRSLLARHTQGQYEWADELAQVWLKRRGRRYEH